MIIFLERLPLLRRWLEPEMAEPVARHTELPREREIWVHCALGQRSYYATCFLLLSGDRVKSLPGGLMPGPQPPHLRPP